MAAAVRTQHAERQPAREQILVHVVHGIRREAADVVAPEGKAGKPERQAAAQFGRHAVIGAFGVAAPVNRIALAAGPGAARPDDVARRWSAGDVRDGLVVAQRIQIVFVKAGAAVGVNAVLRRGFAEIHLDGADAHLQQIGEFALIPLRPFWDWRNPARRLRTAGCPWRRARRGFSPPVRGTICSSARNTAVASSEMWKPSCFKSAIIFSGSVKRVRGKFVVALPVGFKPAGVEVDHVAGNLVLAQLGGDVAHLVLGVVGAAAHPQAERPQRRQRRFAGQLGVFVQNFLGRTEEDEQIQFVVADHQSNSRR